MQGRNQQSENARAKSTACGCQCEINRVRMSGRNQQSDDVSAKASVLKYWDKRSCAKMVMQNDI